MNAFIPIVSQLLDNKHDSCLVDPKILQKKHNLDGPVIIAKTEVYADTRMKWWFAIEDGGAQVILYSHSPCFKSPSIVDIIELLGHKLTLLPNQRLLFHTDGELEQSVTYITLA